MMRNPRWMLGYRNQLHNLKPKGGIMVIIYLFKKFKYDFLGSRWDGEVVREMMDEAFTNKHKVTLDFKKIKFL
jgi:hypothetical protein